MYYYIYEDDGAKSNTDPQPGKVKRLWISSNYIPPEDLNKMVKEADRRLNPRITEFFSTEYPHQNVSVISIGPEDENEG